MKRSSGLLPNGASTRIVSRSLRASAMRDTGSGTPYRI